MDLYMEQGWKEDKHSFCTLTYYYFSIKHHFSQTSATSWRRSAFILQLEIRNIIKYKIINMTKETNKLNIHVYGCEFELHVPKEKELIYLMAAEYVDKKIDAYMDAFVRIPLPQKSTQEILLMAMLDIAVGSIENKQSLENNSILDKIKNNLK